MSSDFWTTETKYNIPKCNNSVSICLYLLDKKKMEQTICIKKVYCFRVGLGFRTNAFVNSGLKIAYSYLFV